MTSKTYNRSTSIERDWKNSAAFKDLLLIGLIAVLAFVFVEAVELAETIDRIRQEHEGLPISEIITFPLIISTAFGAYSLRRWKELRHEIAERKQVEESLRLAYKELEKTNQELKEMQIQLVQTENLASIGQLAAGIAHEINNPLGFISSNFETLQNYIMKVRNQLEMHSELIGQIEASGETELLGKAKAIEKNRQDTKIASILEYIPAIFDDSKEGLEKISKIVKNLREFSRIDELATLDKYNINDGIETALVVVRNQIQSDADIRKELSEVPLIICNPGKINQVLLNILVNAAQAIEAQERDDKGTITIKTYQTDDEVVCEISDDGCGISSETVSKIYEPFFTTKPVGQGTGLGLSVSYDIIVIQHKGKLIVDSTVGKGTKFTIKLPINNQEMKKMKKTTVLFVDDEEKILNSLKMGLMDQPYRKFFAKSGKEALEILKREEVQVIVTDMRMPEMSGLELLRTVKEEYPNIIRMVLSAYTQVTTLLTAINQGEIYKYITKPWKLEEEFKPAIRQAIDYYNIQSERDSLVAESEQLKK